MKETICFSCVSALHPKAFDRGLIGPFYPGKQILLDIPGSKQGHLYNRLVARDCDWCALFEEHPPVLPRRVDGNPIRRPCD